MIDFNLLQWSSFSGCQYEVIKRALGLHLGGLLSSKTLSSEYSMQVGGRPRGYASGILSQEPYTSPVPSPQHSVQSIALVASCIAGEHSASVACGGRPGT